MTIDERNVRVDTNVDALTIARRGVDDEVNAHDGLLTVRSPHEGRATRLDAAAGADAGYDPQPGMRYSWSKEMDISGAYGWQRQDLIDVLEPVRSGQINPVIDRVLPLEETAEGHRLLEDREVFGKVIIVP